MNATDELRRLLNERGVEWHHTSGSLGIPYTWWHSPTMGEVDATEGADGKLYMVLNLDLTPEQAVEATLGRGTCHVESSIIDTYEYNRWEYELSCGHTIIWEDSEPPNYCPDCGRRIEQ